ncbi:Arylsulfatase [Pirellulimonas nuda]|uniref:Arylsulfatase n=1 Tax=Pirellulimonas nuda TaxID=2528009 RepID=A0A518D8T6_9BACT|nr:sulfatase-like hydrolase/transferase [Pirellulimonas nuda]QDU87886.1 Arylsulfatase [Pirellulimonas nuda]
MFIRSLLLLALCQSASNAAGSLPNIVLVFVDDMGWGDLSCFGNEEAQTPNIDRLAAEGIRFEQFYVNSPICSPSRTAISTGQYPQRWRITSFLANRQENERRGMAHWLDPAAPMLARALHDAGYATGHFGKWHMGGQRDVGEAPLVTEYGFDASLTNFEGLGPRVLPLCNAYDGRPPHKHALGSDKLGRGPVTWEDRSLVTAAFADAALQFIKKSEADDTPFYVNIWPDDVHSPFFPPEARRGDAQKRSLYLGVLRTMDEQLAPVFDHIRDSPKLRDNTLVLVCSDNGPEPGAGTAGPFRGTKGMLYEGGIRSPLVVWGPGLIDASHTGQVNQTSVLAAIDLCPSLLEIAGVWPVAGLRTDGEQLSGVLLGRATGSRSHPLYFRRPPDRDSFSGVSNLPDLAVRDGKWKLLCEYDGSNPELYNLDVDPGETTDLSATQRRVQRKMIGIVRQWHESLPPDNGPDLTANQPKRDRK